MNDLVNLQSLFNNRLFRIPIYQRGYAWTLTQLKDFWEDITNLPLNDFEDNIHYTGMLSIKKVSKEIWANWNDEKWAIEENSLIPYEVVDGQQRLTTFIIALFEICRLFVSLEENIGKDKRDIFVGNTSITLYDIEKNYLFIKKPNMIITTYKFGYEKDNPSFNYFINKILENNVGSEDMQTFYTLNLENAKIFFRDNIKALHDEKGNSGVSDLFIKLTQKLVFNVSEIKEGFNEYVAFETINNRGKKLSNLELLKNRLMYLVSLYDNQECSIEDKKNIVDKINEAWKTIYEYLGKNKLSPLNDDDFLMNHWIVYFKYNRGKGEAYRDFLLNKEFIVQKVYDKVVINSLSLQIFNEVVDSNELNDDELDSPFEVTDETKTESKLKPVDILNYVNSLKDMVSVWYKINNPNKIDNYEERKWISKIGRLGFAYFKPLITVSYLKSDINSEQRINMFKKIERYLFIMFKTTGAVSSFGNSEFYGLTNQLYKNIINLDKIYTAMDNRMKDWLFDYNGNYIISSFKNKIDTLFAKKDGYYSWNGLHYVLYEYELYLMENRGMVPKIDWELFIKSDKDKNSIEHIFPQNPDRNDIYWNTRFNNFSKEQKKFLINSIGNLLALSQSKNSSLQNDNFDRKKIGYADGSYSEMEVSRYEEWSAKEIYNRGLDLINFIEKRWDIKISDETDKIKLLCLDFMGQDGLDAEYNAISNSDIQEENIDSINDEPVAYSNYASYSETIYLDFWESFIKYCKDYGFNFQLTNPIPKFYYDVRICDSRCHIALCYYLKQDMVTCELYIPSNKDLFKHLELSKESIEEEINNQLEWQFLDGKKASRIRLASDLKINANGSNWNDAFMWLKTNAEKFKDVFGKYL